MGKFFLDFDGLREYALWYYFRYFPSNKKLEHKLLEKSNYAKDLVDSILKDIKSLLKEDEIIKDKIKNYILRNKNLSYIRRKLLEKLFPKDKLELFLNSELDLSRSILNRESVIKKIENYKQKGKSILYIKQKLVERSEDKVLIDSCVEDVFWQSWDTESLEIEFQKLDWKFGNKKIVGKLLRKWFSYSDIKKRLYK